MKQKLFLPSSSNDFIPVGDSACSFEVASAGHYKLGIINHKDPLDVAEFTLNMTQLTMDSFSLRDWHSTIQFSFFSVDYVNGESSLAVEYHQVGVW